MKTPHWYRSCLYRKPKASALGVWNDVSRKPGSCLWNDMEKMEKPTKERIIHRAYELWEQAGKPDGGDEEFYHQTEQELRNVGKSSPLRTPDNL
jgi:hypothetical protein